MSVLQQQQQPDHHHHQHFGTRGRPTLASIPDGQDPEQQQQRRRQPSSSSSNNSSPLPRPPSAGITSDDDGSLSCSDISVVSSQSEALDLMKKKITF